MQEEASIAEVVSECATTTPLDADKDCFKRCDLPLARSASSKVRPMARRALVTGIGGQDGSYLAELLLGHGYDVYGHGARVS